MTALGIALSISDLIAARLKLSLRQIGAKMPRVSIAIPTKFFLAALVLVNATGAHARCQLPWQNPSVNNVADYLLEHSAVVALVRAAPVQDSNSDLRHSLKIIFPLGTGHAASGDEITLVENPSITDVRTLVDAREIFLLAARPGREREGEYQLNECLEVAISRVNVDELIATLLSRRMRPRS